MTDEVRWVPTWGQVRSDKIHFACATKEEMNMCWRGFYGPEHDGADEPCPRCGLPLKDTPVPLTTTGASHEQEEGSSTEGSRTTGSDR